MHCINEEVEDADEDEEGEDLGPAELPSSNLERVGLAAMWQANPQGICSAKMEDVKHVTISFLLKRKLHIPVFQRRYCWGEDQWEILFKDVSALADGTKRDHSLGRLTCAVPDEESRVLVVDGQQRNTTCTLLLAALRDVAAFRRDDTACHELAKQLDDVLFPDSEALEMWLHGKQSSSSSGFKVEEGEALEFAALVPTYCDRASYFSAVLPPTANSKVGGEWQRPLECKRFFLTLLQDHTAEQLQSMATSILEKLKWLYFPVDTSKGNKDGTENLQVIFERLAVRETMLKPMMQNRSEAADMGAVDFVRNLLLSSFLLEEKGVEMYKQYWLPIEKSMNAKLLEKMLESFLRKQPESAAPLPPELLHVPVGGQLYPRFRRWLAAAVCSTNKSGGSDAAGYASTLDDAEVVERKTEDILKRLMDFSLDYSAKTAAGTLPHEEHVSSPQRKDKAASDTWGDYLKGKSLKLASNDWRCSRCSMRNPPAASECVACRQQRPDPQDKPPRAPGPPRIPE